MEPYASIAQLVEPGAVLVRAWPLEGGASARLTALEVRAARGEPRTFVVREHGAADRAANPDVARHEFELLRLLGASGFPVPPARLLDESRTLLPEPYLVLDYVAGTPAPDPLELAPALAATLSSLHTLPAPAFLRRQDERVAALLASGQGEDPAYPGLADAWPLRPRNAPVLLHGDFWPGNVLWRDGEVAAVVDWEDAAVGDPLADVANARLELLWAFGAEAMDAFTDQYGRESRTVDYHDLPYWDLYAVLRLAPHVDEWGLDAATVQTMRERTEVFVRDALTPEQ